MTVSRLYLPRLEQPPATILEYLVARFAQIPQPVWLGRIQRGLVTTSDGARIGPDTPYRHGLTVHYYREVPDEVDDVEAETIVYQDSDILVADKPHGMPVTPAGEYVARALLSRLERRSGLTGIAPAHRLDRETAGLVLFTLHRNARSRYQALFQTRAIEREYLAVAEISEMPDERQWVVRNRLGPGTPWFRRQIVEGPPNATTRIELVEMGARYGFFRLKPETGRKHQLRAHMASIGFPIVGDPLYPQQRPAQAGDTPLQLLAAKLSFTDPLTGRRREFQSMRTLLLAPDDATGRSFYGRV
ncbi:MAG TPA: pseudouridine synthase [Terriglobia bacterium]|nr:pseudouridine synthase [Terriglobia bacterium]